MITREQLDDFTLAYIEAALWSSNDDSDDIRRGTARLQLRHRRY